MITENALLVQLNISQWTARKLDKRATKEVAAAHAAVATAGRYNKALLPDAAALGTVHTLAAQIRKEYLQNTLPWGMEGTQILPSKNYLDFMSHFRKRKNEWEAAVADFLTEYPTLQADAQRRLGSLFDPTEYPSPDDVARRFKIDLVVLPVPTADFRVTLQGDEVERIRVEAEERIKTASAGAMREVWERLFERVKHIATQTGDPTKPLFASMLENARRDCDLLARLNFAGDPNLEALRQEVESRLASQNIDALRQDETIRSTTAADAQAILHKMAAFM